MRSFLFAPLRHRFAVCAGLALLLTLGFLAAVAATSWPEWKSAVEYHARWGGIAEQCRDLFGKAEAEFQTIERRDCSRTDDANWYECYFANKAIEERVFAPVTKAGCTVTRTSSGADGTEIPSLNVPADPGNPVTFALEAGRMDWAEFSAGFIAALLVLMVAADATRRFISEPHIGWKRLNLVLSVLSGFAVAAYVASDGGSPQAAAGVGLVSIAAVCAAIIYVRCVVLWVIAGFRKEPPTIPPQSAATDTIPFENTGTPSRVAPDIAASVVELDAKVNAAPDTLLAATFWPRMWARCIDLPLCWVLGSLAGTFLPDIRGDVGGSIGVILDIVVGMLFICGAVFVYERFFISKFGATPGKMIFGVSVMSVDNRLPTGEEAGRRAWTYLSSGIYFTLFLPIMQIFGAFMAWRRGTTSQPWDMTARTHVRQSPIGTLRHVVAVVIALSMISAMVVSNKAIKEMSKEEIRRSVIK